MFFLSTLVSIVLLNETFAYITQDTEIILLPASNPIAVKEIPLILKVFGQLIELNLRRNDRIVSPAFGVWKHKTKSDIKKLLELNESSHCFYYHEDHISSAAINFCHENGWEGLVFLENDTIEIRPFWNEFTPMCLIDDFREQTNLSFGKPHVIKKSLNYLADSNLYYWNKFMPKRRHKRNEQQHLTIELAVFFDETAYHMYMPILDNDETKLREMILAYVNQIQALFHHKSFGVSADISLVHLEIMKTQPSFLSTVGDDAVLLSSFCQYATFLKLQDKNYHWDIALYLTGIDLYRMKNEQKDYSSIGKSYHNATCYNTSCGVVEFGTTSLNAFSGFQTFPTAAHEMGHLLGIKHDSKETKKSFFAYPPVKHIMADVQSYRGRVTWSKCSRTVTKQLWKRNPCLRDYTKREILEDALNHSRYHDLPGREWTAKAQCQLFLRDKDANVVTLHDICLVLQCETPHKNEYVFAGPALDGTYCAHGKECRGGKCVPVIEPPYILPYCAQDNWSEWKEDSCKSSCLRKSKGVVIRRRFCEHESYKTTSCSGPYYDVALCDDSSLCTELRDPFYIYTISKCNEYNFKITGNYLDDVLEDRGYQIPHDVKNPWGACTIFCLAYLFSDDKKYTYHYPPREEMLEVGINPYLPDGTWCHYEDGQNYYCRQHYCLPENYSNEE